MSRIPCGWERGKPLNVSKMSQQCGLQRRKHFLNGPTWNLEDCTNLSDSVTCVLISKTEALVEFTKRLPLFPRACAALPWTRTVSKHDGMIRPCESRCSGRAWTTSITSDCPPSPVFMNFILWYTGTQPNGMRVSLLRQSNSCIDVPGLLIPAMKLASASMKLTAPYFPMMSRIPTALNVGFRAIFRVRAGMLRGLMGLRDCWPWQSPRCLHSI